MKKKTKKSKIRHAEHLRRLRENYEMDRKNPNYPRISLKSIFYVTRIYRKAVGPKYIFFAVYRLYTSILSSITAVLAGAAVTAVASAVVTHDLGPFLVLFLILLGTQLLNVILGTINGFLSLRSSQDVYIYASEQVVSKYIDIPLAMRESREFADKFNRVKDFADSIPWISNSIINVISAIISLISIVVATLTVSPIVTIVVLISAIPSSILTLRLSARKRRNWREYTRDRRIAWNIGNKITNSNNALEIEMNGLGSYLIKRMVKASRHSQEQDIIDERRYLWPRFGSNMLETAASYGVLGFVALEIVYGVLEIGQFFTVRTLLLQLNGQISSLFENIASVSENLVNATDYMEFMETPAKPSGNTLVSGIPKIEFKNVSFSYPNSKIKALDNVSFVLEPGESLAIVGENGAGKTTLVKLLIGAYEPTEGTILINDEPLAQIDRKSYLAQLGALFQDFGRYEFATLGENVWFGDVSKSYSRRTIEEALKNADLEELPSRYEKGLNQIMSKDFDSTSATDLSGGQWQRLAVARALFRSPNVLLLDEPTSAIDAKSEYEIFRNILEAQKGKSTLIISHRFSTVRKAKHIIVLDEGRIIESGSHDELVSKRRGVYKSLFELQAEGYN